MKFTVGVEIEVSSGSTESIKTNLAQQGLHRWKVKHDPSCGPEIISPIIRTPKKLAEVKSVTQLLQQVGCRANEKCGLHVHIGLQNTDAAARQRLVKFLARYEEAFFLLTTPQRRQVKWCRPLTERHVSDVMRGEDIQFAWKDRYSPDHDGRYFWVNGKAFATHQTIEFRLMHGTLDADTILGWISLLLMVVENVVTHNKNVRLGKAKAKNARVLVCTMLEQGGCYAKAIDKNLRKVARHWTLDMARKINPQLFTN